MPARVYGYVRVSTEEQARGGVSLDVQSDMLRQYASLKGLGEVLLRVDPGVSGSMPFADRPAGGQLWGELKGGDHLIVTTLDRAWRSFRDFVNTVDDLRKRGVVLHILNLGGIAIDGDNPICQMLLNILAAFADFEREMIRKRFKDAHAHARANGRALTKTNAVLGSKAVRDGGKGWKLIPEDETIAILQVIARLRDRRMTYLAIARVLNRAGVNALRGRSFSLADRKRYPDQNYYRRWNEAKVHKWYTTVPKLEERLGIDVRTYPCEQPLDLDAILQEV